MRKLLYIAAIIITSIAITYYRVNSGGHLYTEEFTPGTQEYSFDGDAYSYDTDGK